MTIYTIAIETSDGIKNLHIPHSVPWNHDANVERFQNILRRVA